jgi:hypothetical protein
LLYKKSISVKGFGKLVCPVPGSVKEIAKKQLDEKTNLKESLSLKKREEKKEEKPEEKKEDKSVEKVEENPVEKVKEKPVEK